MENSTNFFSCTQSRWDPGARSKLCWTKSSSQVRLSSLQSLSSWRKQEDPERNPHRHREGMHIPHKMPQTCRSFHLFIHFASLMKYIFSNFGKKNNQFISELPGNEFPSSRRCQSDNDVGDDDVNDVGGNMTSGQSINRAIKPT